MRSFIFNVWAFLVVASAVHSPPVHDGASATHEVDSVEQLGVNADVLMHGKVASAVRKALQSAALSKASGPTNPGVAVVFNGQTSVDLTVNRKRQDTQDETGQTQPASLEERVS